MIISFRQAAGKKVLIIGACANYLNELALQSPGQYRYTNGCSSFRRSKDTKWKSKHVAGILTNPVYLGHMVQGKTRCSYFEQNGKLRFLPKEDWIIVENTHQALATQEEFEIAAEMAKKAAGNIWNRWKPMRMFRIQKIHCEKNLLWTVRRTADKGEAGKKRSNRLLLFLQFPRRKNRHFLHKCAYL